MATRTTSNSTATLTELRISPKQAKTLLDQGQGILLDVVQPRTWNELDRVAAGAVRIPPDDVERRFHELPRSRAVIAYCT